MGKNTEISWCDHTFNPWWGCVKVSSGCVRCYAETLAKRTGHSVWGVDAPRRFLSDKNWQGPTEWNQSAKSAGIRRRAFCGSMCDWAETHRNTETQARMDAARIRLGQTVLSTPWLDWLFLTKRIESAESYLETMFPAGIPENLWVGTTTENQEMAERRIPYLLRIGAKVRFISVEPQVSRVDLINLSVDWGLMSGGLNWVICGGESGPGFRPFDSEWARSLHDQCTAAGVAFFMKQLGGHPNKHDELSALPADLRIREFPISNPGPAAS